MLLFASTPLMEALVVRTRTIQVTSISVLFIVQYKRNAIQVKSRFQAKLSLCADLVSGTTIHFLSSRFPCSSHHLTESRKSLATRQLVTRLVSLKTDGWKKLLLVCLLNVGDVSCNYRYRLSL